MERAPIRILLVEDKRGDARLLEQLLPDAPSLRWELSWVDSLEQGIDQLLAGGVDLVMLDLELPGSSGIETLLRVCASGVQLPALIVLSGLNDEDVAIQAVQAGAEDYLIIACDFIRARDELLCSVSMMGSAIPLLGPEAGHSKASLARRRDFSRPASPSSVARPARPYNRCLHS